MKEIVSNRVNEEIKSISVRLVGDNVENGVFQTRDALKQARNLNLDLIEINGNENPPICRILDFNKFSYDQKKKQKEKEKKNRQSQSELKEVRFTPNIGENDYNTKKKQITSFLNDGDRVNLVVFFKGRGVMFKEQGEVLLLKLADELSKIATPEKMPSLEGKRMSIILKPKK